MIDAGGAEGIDLERRSTHRGHSESDVLTPETGVGGRATAAIGKAGDKDGVQSEPFGQRRACGNTIHHRPQGQHLALTIGECDDAICTPVGQGVDRRNAGRQRADGAVCQRHWLGQSEPGLAVAGQTGNHGFIRIQRQACQFPHGAS